MGKFIDLAGQRFGRLIVLDRAQTAKNGQTKWRCVCDCGNETIVFRPHLVSGITKSCGCLKQEKLKLGNKTHGASSSRLYRIWKGMRERCRYAGNVGFEYYGAKGVKVCSEWEDFSIFQKWAIENGYDDKLSIDRLDINKDYCPENCRWATLKQQARNTSRTHLFNGKTLSEWSEITGISRGVLACRIYNRKWSLEKAISEPVHN